MAATAAVFPWCTIHLLGLKRRRVDCEPCQCKCATCTVGACRLSRGTGGGAASIITYNTSDFHMYIPLVYVNIPNSPRTYIPNWVYTGGPWGLKKGTKQEPQYKRKLHKFCNGSYIYICTYALHLHSTKEGSLTKSRSCISGL